ncbi:MAG: phosphate signaling complex protein PhoU [Candidatus Krumholzibacteriia bacterium]
MKIHLQREIEQLKKNVFHVSSLVEQSLKLALRAVHESDTDLAGQIRERDREIDALEVAVEEECLKILALHQPVAVDLRFVIAVLKMNNDLERIGDLAVNIAAGQSCMGGESMPPAFTGIMHAMGDKAQAMLRGALESLIAMDPARAREVLAADDAVDADYREAVQMLREEMARRPQEAQKMVCWLLVAKNLERVADQATNIAEDTIYTVEGSIIRHGRG